MYRYAILTNLVGFSIGTVLQFVGQTTIGTAIVFGAIGILIGAVVERIDSEVHANREKDK